MNIAGWKFDARWSALALVLALCGCQAQLTREHRELLRDGEDEYARQRYSVAVTVLDRFLEKAPREAPEWARGLYVRGMSAAQAGNRPQAYKDLRQCVAVAKDRELVWKSYVTLGTLYYEDENWDQAMVNLRAAASRMSPQVPKDAVLFRLGQSFERLGRLAEAQQIYAQLQREFPRSAYRPEAGRKVERASSQWFAVQAGSFANPANAQRRVNELRGLNLDAYVRAETEGRAPRHVVLVGRYASRADAERQLQQVRRHVRDAVIWP
jgi:tetratricopeptide (TPR) repeat protein